MRREFSRRILRPLVAAVLLVTAAVVSNCSAGRQDGIDGAKNPADGNALSTVTNAGPANKERTEAPQGEVSVTALSLVRKGQTKVFRTDPTTIPDAPSIPNGYESLNVYELESEAVFSDAMITIKAPIADDNDFKKARILRLVDLDLYPSGSAWLDCTVLQADKRDSRIDRDFRPDPSNKSLSCHFDQSSGVTKNYFALVLDRGELNREASTDIRLHLDKTEPDAATSEVRYVVTFTNAGPHDVAEVNFDSTFSLGVQLVDVRPTRGECKRSRYGSSDSSVVCYLGNMKVHETATVEFLARPGRENPPIDRKFNRRWTIRGFSRRAASDRMNSSDRFSFEPLAK